MWALKQIIDREINNLYLEVLEERRREKARGGKRAKITLVVREEILNKDNWREVQKVLLKLFDKYFYREDFEGKTKQLILEKLWATANTYAK